MVALGCGITLLILGVALAVVVGYVGFVTVPNIIENTIIGEVVLINDTIQLDRFRDIPFPLNFTVRMFNISNQQDVLNNGVPVVHEVGPYIYKLYRQRDEENITDDTISYRIMEHYEFDAEASYPNTDDDLVTIVNMPYHAILQVAESISMPMNILNQFSGSIFGQHNSPVMTTTVKSVLFEGIPICQNPGLLALVACIGIRANVENSANMVIDEDNTIWFSFLSYKNGIPSELYEVDRGLTDHRKLANIYNWSNSTYLSFWANNNIDDTENGENGENGSGNGETAYDSGENYVTGTEYDQNETLSVSVCNMLNGTDTGIFHPFVKTDDILYGFNSDICRSVELRYQSTVEYEGIEAYRFAVNEWLFDNDDGCFCLNVTQGLTRSDGCLHRGAMELYSCTESFAVLTYPHFLFADFEYSNGVVGVTPVLDKHRIFVDLEPNTGTVLRGAKRVQFNIFSRPITAITNTQNLRTTLVPIFWIEEAMQLPDELVDEISSRLLHPLRLVAILRPTLMAITALVLYLGIVLIIIAKCTNKQEAQRAVPTSAPTEAAKGSS